MADIVLNLRRLSLAEFGTATTNMVPAFVDLETRTVVVAEGVGLDLEGVPSVRAGRGGRWLESIPKAAGCYWIWTNEPVRHCLNAGARVPSKIRNSKYTVVYNGVSSNLQQRARDHLDRVGGLFGEMSGISVDLLLQQPTAGKSSHAKCAWACSGKKLPKIQVDGRYRAPASKEELASIMHLSRDERGYLQENSTAYFKNGIQAGDPKHRAYEWHFSYVECADARARTFIEHSWREEHGVPVLCSYVTGR